MIPITVLGAVLSLAMSGCDNSPGKPDPALRPVAPNKVVDFDTLFQRSCVGCHGQDGTLGPAPPLNDPLFLEIIPDAELERIVRDGRHGTSMPVFSEQHGGTLTNEQILILASGIKSKWQSQPVTEGAIPPYIGRAGNAENGAKLFAAACAGCHGDEGVGGDAGTINNVAFLSLISDQALRRLIITGRPDLGMPDYADNSGRDGDFAPLSSDEIDDLVSLLAVWRTGSGVSSIK